MAFSELLVNNCHPTKMRAGSAAADSLPIYSAEAKILDIMIRARIAMPCVLRFSSNEMSGHGGN
jgi:hypothetical protein